MGRKIYRLEIEQRLANLSVKWLFAGYRYFQANNPNGYVDLYSLSHTDSIIRVHPFDFK